MQTTTINELPIEAQATILRVSATGEIRQRLMAMGLITGAVIQLVRRAPLGDPLQILCRGVRVSLRKSEAELVIVKPEVSHV